MNDIVVLEPWIGDLVNIRRLFLNDNVSRRQSRGGAPLTPPLQVLAAVPFSIGFIKSLAELALFNNPVRVLRLLALSNLSPPLSNPAHPIPATRARLPRHRGRARRLPRAVLR